MPFSLPMGYHVSVSCALFGVHSTHKIIILNAANMQMKIEYTFYARVGQIFYPGWKKKFFFHDTKYAKWHKLSEKTTVSGKNSVAYEATTMSSLCSDYCSDITPLCQFLSF